MEKKINLSVLSLAIDILMTKTKNELEDAFIKWPEDSNGTTVTLEQVRMALVKLETYGMKLIEDMVGELPEPVIPEFIKPVINPVIEKEIVTARYHGRHKINDRPVWYFKERMEDYPSDFDIIIRGCGTMKVRGNIGIRKDFDENFNVVRYNQSRDRSFVRQSLVVTDPRGMVVVGSRQCKSKECHLIITKKVQASVTEKPVVELITPDVKYNSKIVMSHLRFLHNKSFTWLNETGGYFGGKVKFVWPECDGFELIVPDARDDFSPRGHSHATYFCGTKNKPEESNGLRASIFGPPGCRATFVEIHYNV